MMHLASLNVITDAGRSLSLIINPDLDILQEEICSLGSTALLSTLHLCLKTSYSSRVFVTPSTTSLIWA